MEKEEGPAAEAEDGERLLRKIMYASGSTTPAIMIAAPTRYLAGEGAPTSSSILDLCRSLDLDLERWKPGEEEGASEADGTEPDDQLACGAALPGVRGQVWACGQSDTRALFVSAFLSLAYKPCRLI